MTKKTKMVLGVAVAVGVSYWLYSKYGKKSTTSKFSGFTEDADFFNAGGLGVFNQPRQSTSTPSTTTSSAPTNYSPTFNVEGCRKLNPNCTCYDRACEKCKCPQPNVEPFYYIAQNPNVHP